MSRCTYGKLEKTNTINNEISVWPPFFVIAVKYHT